MLLGAREEVEKVRVYYDNHRHLGLGKIAFRSVAVATRCAIQLDGVRHACGFTLSLLFLSPSQKNGTELNCLCGDRHSQNS